LVALVAVGGAIGSVVRFWVATLMLRATGPGFPWGTVLINILGSFVIGWLAAWIGMSRLAMPELWRAFAMTGICGGFTTFSAFSLQTVELLREGQVVAAGLNVVVSVVACVVATFAGIAVGRG
jgi:CrcB protein